MLTADAGELRQRAEGLARALPAGTRAHPVEGASEVGGGSFPGATLRTWLVRLAPAGLTADELVTRLREADPPVIARIEANHVVLDPRTILAGEEEAVVRAAEAALGA
jgi:L-seryl-tRNA(Ser) seleniumtransferase